jgi:hypothetical protein
MGKAVANEDIVLTIDPPSIAGVITIVSPASIGVKVGGSGVYSGPLSFSVSNLIDGNCGVDNPGNAVGVIIPTSTSMMVDNMPVIREEDESVEVVSIGAMEPSSPSPIPCVINFKVKVSFAGQVAVTAD